MGAAAAFFPPFDPLAGPPRRDVEPFPEADLRLLNALAACQLLYGRPEEALAFLQLSLRLQPDDPQTLRLLAEAFLAAGDAASAETLIAAHEEAVGRGRLGPRDLLRRARALMASGKPSAAAAAFVDYLRGRGR